MILAACKGGAAPDAGTSASATPSQLASTAATTSAPVRPDLATCRQAADQANPDLERRNALAVPAALIDKLAANRNFYAVSTLDGQTLCVSTSWMESVDHVKLSADGRFLTFAWAGNEAGGFILADRTGKGQETETGAEPVFAPGGRKLAAVEFSESGFGSLNGFAVWQVEAQGLRQLAKLDVPPERSDWRIDGWSGEACVKLSAVPSDEEPGKSNRQHFAAKVSGKGWTIAPGTC
jgi:hypothetical protein